jgi:hypothetical protein
MALRQAGLAQGAQHRRGLGVGRAGAIRLQQVGMQAGIGQGVAGKDPVQRILGAAPEILVLGRPGQAADPAVLQLLHPPIRRDLAPVLADAPGQRRHRRVHVQQRAIGVEDDGADGGGGRGHQSPWR